MHGSTRRSGRPRASARLLLAGILAAAAVFGSMILFEFVAAPETAAQGQDSEFELIVWPTYLGPDVVVSGSAGSDAGAPDVRVVVENLDTGFIEYDDLATTALRPPLGIPSISWRVPLLLNPGNYRVTASSETAGSVIDSDTGDFAVVSEGIESVGLLGDSSTWSYYDLGEEPADQNLVRWHQLGYDADGWATGSGDFGYGDGDEDTVTNAVDAAGETVLTTYFRHEFDFADSSVYDGFIMWMLRDDGAVTYLNGVEVGRTNMPEGAVTYETLSINAIRQMVRLDIDPALLQDLSLIHI